MNSLMVKSLVFTAILMLGTLMVVWQMDIDFNDPINWITLLGALVIAGLSFGVAAKYMAQMQNDTASGELADENWDGIGEYQNELPSGWAYSFLATMIWGIWYFLFSPYSLNAYNKIGEWNQEVKNYNKKFEKKFANADEKTLKGMGASIFDVKCAPCHGDTGDGLSGQAQDLTTPRSKEQILGIIKNGQNAIAAFPGGMPPGLAQGAAAEKAAAYVAGGFQGTAPAEYGVCAGCHGADGKGMPNVAPRINGYDVADVLKSGKVGSIGTMPSFKTTLTPIQTKALETFISKINE